MADRRYEPSEIEPKWQELWARERTWEVSNEHDGSELAYVLEMLPYPSGEPHIGHLKNYALGDAIAHFRRRIGQRVLHPMGYDAFGRPPKTTPSTPASIPGSRRTRRSRRSRRRSARGVSRSTGRVSSPPTNRRTTGGRSGSS